MKKTIYFILIFFGLSCKPSYKINDVLEGKYQMLQENNYKLSSIQSKVIKEYKDGEFRDYKYLGGGDKLKRFSGKYFMINDSVYVEYLDIDNMSNQLTGKAYAFKYSIKGDTLIQEGTVQGNKLDKDIYRMSYFKTYYIKVE